MPQYWFYTHQYQPNRIGLPSIGLRYIGRVSIFRIASTLAERLPMGLPLQNNSSVSQLSIKAKSRGAESSGTESISKIIRCLIEEWSPRATETPDTQLATADPLWQLIPFHYIQRLNYEKEVPECSLYSPSSHLSLNHSAQRCRNDVPLNLARDYNPELPVELVQNCITKGAELPCNELET